LLASLMRASTSCLSLPSRVSPSCPSTSPSPPLTLPSRHRGQSPTCPPRQGLPQQFVAAAPPGDSGIAASRRGRDAARMGRD
jgi:hypothetical protein